MSNLEPETFLKEHKSLSSADLRKAILFNYASGLFVIAQAWLLAFIINALLFENKEIADITLYICALMGVFVLRFLLSSVSGYFTVKATTNIKQKLREKLYKNIQEKGPHFITSQGSGALMNSLTKGIETLGKYYQDFIPTKALVTMLPVSIWLFILPTDWVSALVMFLTAPLIPVFMILIGKGAENLNKKQWQKMARMSNHFLDTIQGLTTLKLLNASKKEEKSIAATSENYRKETMRVLRLAFLSSVTLEFFSTVSIAIVAVFIGFRLLWAEIAFMDGFFVLLLAPEFYQPLRKMGAAYHARMEALGAAEKIVAAMAGDDKEEARKQGTDLKSISIRYENISHSYNDSHKALHDINFEIKSGSKTALVGPSGSGKSTIMALLLGFIQPQEGELYINDEALSQLDKEQWRQTISWIPQHPTLFYGSVIDNIRLGNQEATDEEIISLCQKLEIDVFIKNLPQGYQTLIGEKGFGLSGGQIQRLAIARAFLREAPLILMDEPTASLDQDSEKLLNKAINKLSENRTVMVIAHRIHTIQNADQILFLQEGKIIDSGSHKNLLKKNAAYESWVNQDLFDTTCHKEVA